MTLLFPIFFFLESKIKNKLIILIFSKKSKLKNRLIILIFSLTHIVYKKRFEHI